MALAERAADADAPPADDPRLRVFRGRRPPLLDRAGQVLVTGLMAGVLWTASTLATSGEVSHAYPTLDPVSFLVRVLAWGFSVRALLQLGGWLGQLKEALRARSAILVTTPEGLFLRWGGVDRAVPRDAILGISGPTSWHSRSGEASLASVFLALAPGYGPHHIRIPAVFTERPGELTEALQRWLGPDLAARIGALRPSRAEAAASEHGASTEDELRGAAAYQKATEGGALPGWTTVGHGYGWLLRGPYGVLLFGLAAADGLLRAPTAPLSATLPLIAALFVCVGAPLLWAAFRRSRLAERGGLSMVLTPHELLIRAKGRLLSCRHRQVTRTYVDARRRWSLLRGAYTARTLVIHRLEAPPIRYDEAYLGAPAEVVQRWIDAYRCAASEDEASTTDVSA